MSVSYGVVTQAGLPLQVVVVPGKSANEGRIILNRGPIPLEIRAQALGPRLAAVMSYFSGRHHRFH